MIEEIACHADLLDKARELVGRSQRFVVPDEVSNGPSPLRVR
jgi:hypothetical protein